MNYKFTVADLLIFLILFFNFYISTILPGMLTVKNYIYIIGLVLSFALLLITFNPAGAGISFRGTVFFSALATALILSFILSSIYSSSFSSGIRTIAKTLLFFPVVYFFFAYLGKKLCFESGAFDAYIRIFYYSGIFLSITGIFMLVTGIGLRGEYSFTSHGLFVHPNTASFIYIVTVPAAIYLLGTGKISMTAFVPVIVLLIVTLLLTFSRAGYIGTFSAMIIYLFLNSRKRLVFTAISLLAIIAGVNLLMDFITAKQDSSFGRMLLALAAVNMIIESTGGFLWGYGVFRGLEIFRDEKLLFGSYEFVDDPHNFVLLMGIQFGMIVTAISLLIILYVITRVLLMKKEHIEIMTLRKIHLSLAVCSGLLINNMFEDIIVYPEYYVMPVFLMFLGYLYNIAKPVNNGQ